MRKPHPWRALAALVAMALVHGKFIARGVGGNDYLGVGGNHFDRLFKFAGGGGYDTAENFGNDFGGGVSLRGERDYLTTVRSGYPP